MPRVTLPLLSLVPRSSASSAPTLKSRLVPWKSKATVCPSVRYWSPKRFRRAALIAAPSICSTPRALPLTMKSTSSDAVDRTV